MMHYEFLAKILQSNCCYWVLARMSFKGTGRERADDEILLVCIDEKIRLGIKSSDILFDDLEALSRSKMVNVFLSGNYPPFQSGLSFYDVYDGFPIDRGRSREFLKEAINNKSTMLHEYKDIYEKILLD